MSFDHLGMLRRIEPEHKLTHQELVGAISRLYDALNLLMECEQSMEEGTYTFEFPAKLAESWKNVNQCRIYTEKILFLEETLIPSMGLIYDAKAMFDSMVAWKLGMTKYGHISILTAIREAEHGVRFCIEELENWIGDSTRELEEAHEAVSG